MTYISTADLGPSALIRVIRGKQNKGRIAIGLVLRFGKK